MNSAEQLNSFLQRITSDANLTTIHLGVCTALVAAWNSNSFNNSFSISRTSIIKASRIKSKSTYHKVIVVLVRLKYLEYTPSFHPKIGSTVSFLFRI